MVEMTYKPWLYFGCGPRKKGHYLYTENGQKLHYYGRPDSGIMKMCWDGNLAPQPEPADPAKIYRASLTRLGGWGYSALSWWDRSGDSRSQSNSTILAPDIAIDPAVMLDEAYRRFPWVFSRLPQPLAIVAP